MKTKLYLHSIMALAIAASLSACDENAWNNHLDGFEEENDKPISNVQTIEYTLTDADYAAIAANATNKTLAGDEKADALKAVASRKAFSEAIPASQYVPAFLSSTSFAHFTATDGSAVKLTFNVAQALPAELDQAAKAQTYTVSEDDYMYQVWDSEEDYINGFAPSHSASRYLPEILRNSVIAEAGEYVVVSYNQSAQEPVFGNNETPDVPKFELSSTIGYAVKGEVISCKAIVSAICAQGYIVSDNSGSILVYMGSSFDATSIEVGQQVEIDGTIGSYNKGLQITGSSATVTVVGKQEMNYPAAKVMSGADVDAAITRTSDELAQYVQIKGKASISGNYVNIIIDGAEKAQGSVYQGTAAQKALFTNEADVTIEGYFIAISGGRFFNMVITKVNGASANVASVAPKTAADVPTTSYNAVYQFNGSSWSIPSNFVVLNPADYTAMGQRYQNLTEPAKYLPAFLRTNFPYAQADDVKNVMYLFYNSSSKQTYYACDQYTFNGSEWIINNGIIAETAQFVRTGGKWMYDPCVTINLPAGRNQEVSTKYYQACVDWVFENICKPLGDTSIKSGKFYVSSYGNNE